MDAAGFMPPTCIILVSSCSKSIRLLKWPMVQDSWRSLSCACLQGASKVCVSRSCKASQNRCLGEPLCLPVCSLTLPNCSGMGNIFSSAFSAGNFCHFFSLGKMKLLNWVLSHPEIQKEQFKCVLGQYTCARARTFVWIVCMRVCTSNLHSNYILTNSNYWLRSCVATFLLLAFTSKGLPSFTLFSSFSSS